MSLVQPSVSEERQQMLVDRVAVVACRDRTDLRRDVVEVISNVKASTICAN